MKTDEEIRKLCDAATPGPWNDEIDYDPSEAITRVAVVRDEVAVSQVAECFDSTPWRDAQCIANAQFIAAARAIVPELLARAQKAEAERDAALADGVLSRRVCDIENDRDQLRADLAAMTAARDEACDLAASLYDEGAAGSFVVDEIEPLRAVGKERT